LSTVRRIAKNAAVLLIAQSISYLLALLYMMYWARYLGPANYGIVTFAIAFTAIFTTLADFGLLQLTVREISKNKEQVAKYIVNVSMLRVILAIIAYGLIALVINVMGYPWETRLLVYLIGISVVINSFNLLFLSIFQAYEKMELQAIGQILQVLFTFGGILIIVHFKLSLIYFGYISIIASLLFLTFSSSVTTMKLLRNQEALSPQNARLDWRLCKVIIREAIPFGLIAIFSSIYYSIDSVIISYTQGNSAVGYYGAAYRIIQALLFIPTVWSISIFPVMVKLHIGSQESLAFTVEKSFKYLTMLAIPMGAGLTILARQAILVTFGTEYMPSVIALQILVWATVFLFMGVSFTVFLQSINRQVTVTKILALCTALNFILNIIFIPKFGYISASIILLLTSLILFILLSISSLQARNSLTNKKFIFAISKILLASLLMGIFVYHFQKLSLLILIPSAICIYFLVIFAMRALDKEDLLLLRECFK
jgi:O-antigen/teichoic acid export membrane protein